MNWVEFEDEGPEWVNLDTISHVKLKDQILYIWPLRGDYYAVADSPEARARLRLPNSQSALQQPDDVLSHEPESPISSQASVRQLARNRGRPKKKA